MLCAVGWDVALFRGGGGQGGQSHRRSHLHPRRQDVQPVRQRPAQQPARGREGVLPAGVGDFGQGDAGRWVVIREAGAD